MKNLILILLSFILLIPLTSCTVITALPSEVTLNEVEYKLAFSSGLYPTYEGFPDADSEEIKILSNSFYKYPPSSFPCYIAYDSDGITNIYFDNKGFDKAKDYYNDSDNYNYYCILGNIYDEKAIQIETSESEVKIIDKLISFADEYGYSPFLDEIDEKDLVTFSAPENWNEGEIHLYKESKDGAFSTSNGHTFRMIKDKLYLLYNYDFSDDDVPTMTLYEVPKKLNDQLCPFIKEINATE